MAVESIYVCVCVYLSIILCNENERIQKKIGGWVEDGLLVKASWFHVTYVQSKSFLDRTGKMEINTYSR